MKKLLCNIRNENDGSRRDKSYGLGRVGFPRTEPAVAVQAVSIKSVRSSVAKFDYPIAT